MSIATEINRIKTAKNTLKTKLNNKNDLQHQISTETLDEYGDFVDSIPTGTDTSDATATASNILTGKTAYISTGKVNGSMTNNGTLSYTPSSSTQIIPAGYTSGGTISAMDITESDDYNTCLGLSEQIMGGTPYTELTYIQSSGTQWIDTLVTGKGYTKIDVKFDTSNYNTSSEHCILGSRIFSSSNIFLLGLYSGGWYGYNSSQGSPMQLIGGIYEVRLDKGKFYWFNTTTGNWDLKNTYTTGTFTTPSNMILFGERRSDTVTQLSSIKLYYCKIYENDTLVRNFIPVKDPNNVVCLYDKVSNDYFYNSGSGTFIAGGEV